MMTRVGEIDRIGICEVYSCIAHDWGLYRLNTRLYRLGFKPSIMLTTEKLEESQKDLYNEINLQLENNEITETDEGRLK